MRRALIIILFSLVFSGCATTEQENAEYMCSDIQSCAQNIMLRVREKSHWICDQKSNDKTVVVKSTFSKSGDLIYMKLSSSSGDKEFDTAALNAVKAAAPFKELTMLSPKDFEEVSVIDFKFVGNKESK
ncbi:TonB family protein [Lacimicrobium alkaliphilum]|uniref:TonB C-terminal domain-containing protein n=1 Tax=Lacimicrobium alkaliphilum TaxID=1526571 RepID=A0A0U3B4P3_9ALTE|nr:TonB family protein [Lacimicrobium alkaliphilum]ALT00049.1 hypothetical protein AT746_18420 [Lacimicrobium alkaliphilum]